MALYPGARVRLLPEAGAQPTIRATQVILHVAVSEADSLYGYWTTPGNGLESHFFVAYDGSVEQYVDTARSADANYTANRRPDGTGAISVETAGLGDGTWTPQQLDSLVAICRWAHAKHGVPLRRCPDAASPGIGWHVMFGAPGPWTPAVGKICPGPRRIEQFSRIIMPRLTEEPMPMNDGDAGTLWGRQHAWPAAYDDVGDAGRMYALEDYVVGARVDAKRAARDAKAALDIVTDLKAAVATLAAKLAA